MRIEFKWLRMALKNTQRNRRRSLVTLAICGIGTAAALLGGGFALFNYQALAQMSARDTGHLILAAPGYFDGTDSTPMAHGLPNAQQLARRLLARPGVERVLPRLQFGGLVSNGDKSEIVIGTGVDADQEFLVKGPFLVREEGVLLDSQEPGKGPGIVIGKGLARSLGAHPGSVLTLLSTTAAGSLNALDVTVTGVVSTGVTEVDKRFALVDLSTAQSLLATDKVSTLGVYLDDIEATDSAATALRGELGNAAEVRTWVDLAMIYQSVHGLYDRIFGFVGLVVLVIILFAVTNTVAMAVLERTREIGTLRAMGTTPAEITRLFTLEGLVLGAGGAVSGMLLAGGAALALLVFHIEMPPPPGRSTGYPLHVAVAPMMYAAAACVVVLMSACASFIASRKAANQAVVEALAHV
jgi:putative ABC transport system permease protein